MTFIPRYYQTGAIAATFDFWRRGGGNPLIELATGTGKSGVAGTLAKQLCGYKTDMRIGVIAHVQELIEQNAREMLEVWPGAASKVGIYSAGVGRRDHAASLLFGGIQSIYKKAGVLGRFDVILIDEAHLVPRKSDTMYGRFLADVRDMNPDIRIAGLTATPYRLESGRLDEGDGRVFHEIVYSYDIAAGIKDGYLSPLSSKIGTVEINVDGVPIKGGEFLEKALQERALNPDLIIAACREFTAYFRQTNRRKAMVFCTGIAHAYAVAETLNALGLKSGVVTGEMDRTTRRNTIEAYKEGYSECLVNVGVLTTGFNVKGVDQIGLMRSTLSTGLYLQMIGRGTRLVVDVNNIETPEDRRAAIAASIKPDCLVLDYGGNFRRHGPVDEILGMGGRKAATADDPVEEAAPVKVKADTVRGRECEQCRELLRLRDKSCAKCGWTVPPELFLAQHEREAESGVGVTKAEDRPDWREVTTWDFARHEKSGKPPSFRIDYHGPEMRGMRGQSEWLPFESDSQWARSKAAQIWYDLGGDTPAPVTVDDALDRVEELTMPVKILVRLRDGFREVAARSRPEAPAPNWTEELGDEIPF